MNKLKIIFRQITDAGLRSLGQCHLLTHVNICALKQVSDVGLTSLATGCPKLKTLLCDGLYLLSDPRLISSLPKSKSSLKVHRQNIIGIASLAQFCPNLETLHACGCFQLNVTIQKYLSRMKLIKELNLSGCTKLQSSALISLALGCPQLEDLNLSDCSAAVSDDVIQALGGSCRGLKSVSLARCEGFQSIKSLSLCQNLKLLDLSGCRSLSDSSLLPICDEKAVPLLSHLYLSDVASITDQSIAWIAFGCGRLVLLSIKGTQVHGFTAKALKDSFPCSTLLRNKNFFGFWPIQRYRDRQLVQSYITMKNGLIKLQSVFRSTRARVHCHELKMMKIAHIACEAIQCCWRQFLARRILKCLRDISHHLNMAAMKITALFRMRVAHQVASRYRLMNLIRHKYAMATKIQVHWRILCDRRRRIKMIEHRANIAAARVVAVIKLQSFLRQKFAVVKVARIKQMKRVRERMVLQKAVVIGRYYRGYMTRNKIRRILTRRKHLEFLKQELANKLLRIIKMRRLWHEIGRRANLRLLQNKSAIRMQALARSFLARLFVAGLRTELNEKVFESSVIKIQNRWKVKKAMTLLRDLRVELMEMYMKKAWASTQLAKYWRGRKARIYFGTLKLEAQEAEIWRRKVIRWAAIMIQAAYRGFKGRKRFEKFMREKRGLWVELFDEAKQKRFFYSKLTNEIRWQIPGDLLALIPRPICDNCDFYEGICECSDCQETFCQQCFDQVHYGGKRKAHEFRCLYDYYGNRVDYGDDVFPSKWPSEVIQDEIQGWMLRVAPIRNPTNVYGAWEVYDSEITTASGSLEIRRFYFNRDTFEATYSPPPALESLIGLENSGALSVEDFVPSGALVPYTDSPSLGNIVRYEDSSYANDVDAYYTNASLSEYLQ